MSSEIQATDLKSAFRDRLLRQRERLHEHRRRQLDRAVCAHLLRFLDDRDCLHLAAYHAFRGEPDLAPALEALHHAGRRVYLPVVDGSEMSFRRWQPGAVMTANRFGIPEPLTGRQIEVEQLELVMMPLVAFSAAGTRLGMGAGFYDRRFAFCLDRPDSGPLLVGAAYGVQEVDSLPAERWDVPLDAVITERGVRYFRNSAA